MQLKLNFVNLFVIPGITGGVAAANAVKHLHDSLEIGYSSLNAGLFGLVQTLFAGALYNNLKMTGSRLADYAICHIIAGTGLYGVTVVALKTGLLVTTMTAGGASIVILATLAGALGGKLLSQFIQKCFFPHHKENV